MSDGQLFAASLFGGDHLLALLNGVSHRLFKKHVYALIKEKHRTLAVKSVRKVQNYGIALDVAGDILVIKEIGNSAFLCKRLNNVLLDVAKSGKPAAFNLFDRINMR